MTNLEIVFAVIGGVGVVLSAVFAYVAFLRGKKADDTSVAEENGHVLAELGYIKAGIDDIKHKQTVQDERHIEVMTRLTAVEESTKQAHKRIDEHVYKS